MRYRPLLKVCVSYTLLEIIANTISGSLRFVVRLYICPISALYFHWLALYRPYIFIG